MRELPTSLHRDAAAWPHPVRVGIDGEALRTPLSGVGQYVFQLCRELERLLPPHVTLYAYARLPESRLALPSSRWILRREAQPLLRKLPSFLWLRTRGAALCAQDGIDIFWAGRTLHPRLPPPIRTVCTVHDLNHLVVPETMQRATRWSHQLWFERDLRHADAVVANSRGTAQRLRSALGIEPAAVVRPGLEARFHPLSEAERTTARAALARLGIAEPYLLSVATLEPRKNVEAVFRAFLELKERGALPRHQLVLAGKNGWHNRALSEALRAAHGRGVRTPGYVPDELLPALYALSDLVLLPSLYEGFGMPALEARACGARVLVSDAPELCEAAGAEGIVVAPTVLGIRLGIQRALSGTRPSARTPRALDEVHREFSWSVGASRLAGVLARG